MNQLPCRSEMHLFKQDHSTFLLDVPTMRLFRLEGEDVFTVLQVFQQAFNEASPDSPNVDLIALCEEAVRNRLGEAHSDVREIYSELARFNLVRPEPLPSPQPLHEISKTIQALALVPPLSISIAQKAVNLLCGEAAQRRRSLIFWGPGQFRDLKTLKSIMNYARRQAASKNCQLDLILDVKTEELTEEVLTILCKPDVFARVVIDADPSPIDQNQSQMLRKLLGAKPSQVMARVRTENKDIDFAACMQALSAEGFKIVKFSQPVRSDQACALAYMSLNKSGRIVSNLLDIAAACHLHLFRTRACTAGISFFAVANMGKIYPCPQFASREFYEMGHVNTGIDIDQQAGLSGYGVDCRDACQGCGVRYFCGGGCLYHTLTNHDGISPTEEDCVSFHHWLETALIWYSQAASTDKALLDTSLAVSSRFHPYHVSSLAGFRPRH